MSKHRLNHVTNGYKSHVTGTTLPGASLGNNPASISSTFLLLSLTSPLCTEHWSAKCLCQRYSLLFHSFSFSLLSFQLAFKGDQVSAILKENLSSQTSFLFQLPALLSPLVCSQVYQKAICTWHHLASQERQPPLPWPLPHLFTCSPP